MNVDLTDSIVRNFRVVKLFGHTTDTITCMDMSPDGDHLISGSKDDQIVVYDCNNGTASQPLFSKKYGVDFIRFTHDCNTALHTSTKVDDSIRYINVNDNKYIRYFPGHTKKVISLCMSPTQEIFLSGSMDKTLRLWDLRSSNSTGLLHLSGEAVAAFDPEGLIFAAGANSEFLKFYDLRAFDKGPFHTYQLTQQKECVWSELKFSRDGKYILISTTSSLIRLIDAFYGTPLQTFTAYANLQGLPIEACFSPDCKYIFSGSSDGRIHVWNAETGHKICVLNGDHVGPVHCIRFNPKYAMFASGCSNMLFWLPKPEGLI